MRRTRSVARSRHLAVLGEGDEAWRPLARELLSRCSFPPPGASEQLHLAVSGGADSLALLLLAAEAGFSPVAHHVDHGLRPGSEAEVEVVKGAALRVGAEVVSHRVQVAPGPNLEARARAARLAVLPKQVATGHTADDQAETVLINLLRGSSTAGLAGIPTGERHPIMGLRRTETRTLCAAAGLKWVDDPSNAELGPLRNRIRHDLLPQLSEASGRDLVPVLCRQCHLLLEDEALLEELSMAIDVTAAKELAAAPLPLGRRAVRRWLRQLSPYGHPPSAATVERVLNVASGAALACDVGGGASVRRRRGRLVLQRAGIDIAR
jgi:tRNA(Ile)-lysidine synthase